MGVLLLDTITIHFKSSILKSLPELSLNLDTARYQKRKSKPSGDSKFQQWSLAKIKNNSHDGKYGKGWQ